MLHLFKKIYLEIDERLTTFNDRVVISKNHGFRIASELETIVTGKLIDFSPSIGELIGKNKKYENILEFLNFLSDEQDKNNKPITIFADTESYFKIIAYWYKLILKNPSLIHCNKILKSYFFKERMFSNSRLSISQISFQNYFLEDKFEEYFNNIYIDPNTKKEFLEKNKNYLSVEYLLSSYLYDESCKEELKDRVKILIQKDLEKYLYELKEIILVHLMRKKFQQKLNVSKVYDFDNFEQMIDDSSPLIKVFFKEELWSQPGLTRASSSKTINFKNMSEEDIDNIMKFTEISGEEWEEENFYRFNKSDMGKMAFVKHLQSDSMSDAGLKEIINFEIRGNHAAGSFYSLDTQTVNHYFVDFIFNCIRENKKEEIRFYCV